MATRSVTRHLLTTAKQTLASSSSHSLLRLRPLVTAASNNLHYFTLLPHATSRGFATRPTSSSLSDPNPNWSNRPPKETILLDGCDFEHWLVVMEKPEGDPTRDEIIDSYIKTLATVVGSEEEARMKIYSVSTRHYFAFGALVSEELSYKLKELPRVRWVLPDSYLDVKNKDYGGEPFINGQAVPYDPKYHEEWVRNNARANERNRRNDRPRNFDRSRNFERRREMPNTAGPPGNMGRGPPPNMGGGPPGNMGPPPNMGGGPPGNMGPPPNMGGGPPGNMGPPPNMGGGPPRNMGPPPNMGGGQPNNMGGVPPPNMGGMQPHNTAAPQNYMQGGQVPPNNMGGVPPNNMGAPVNHPPNFQYGNGPNSGGMAYQSGPGPNHSNFVPNSPGGSPYQNHNNFAQNPPSGNPYQDQNMSGRDMPPPPPRYQ